MKDARKDFGRLLFMAAFELLGVPALVGGADAGIARAAEPTQRRQQVQLPLKRVVDIPLPGPRSRFDYQSYDAERHLLFIAHLGAGTVIVFDTQSRRVVAEVPNIKSVHGVLVVPELRHVYASATATNEVVVLDEDSLKEIARVPGGTYPDGMAYAPEVHKLYVSDESGRTETVIDTAVNKRIATISLDGEVGNTQYDPASKHIFVNVQTANQLVEIDPQTDAIVARHALAGADHNHGLLIDPRERVAFVACEGNNRLLVVDMRTMRVTAWHQVGEGPDVLAFDEALHLLYVASESGVVSLFQEQSGAITKLGEALLEKNAHTVAVDVQTHESYFPLQNVDGRPVMRILQPSA